LQQNFPFEDISNLRKNIFLNSSFDSYQPLIRIEIASRPKEQLKVPIKKLQDRTFQWRNRWRFRTL